MDIAYYLDKFNEAANSLDKRLFTQKQLQVKAGVWLNAVALKLQKNNWANTPPGTFQQGPSIFFSVWLNEEAIKEQKLFYNIHALKLRQFKGFLITSREFATAFREKFRAYEKHWPNVSTQYGPQTLMQGWQTIDLTGFQHEIIVLANKFLGIEYLIDELLDKRRKNPQ